MNYEAWRKELFGHPADSSPYRLEHLGEFYYLEPALAFDYVDRMLVDDEVHDLFSKQQIGNGIITVYSNDCGDIPFLYTQECDEVRRVQGIRNLVHLYRNYFERYCKANVARVGSCQEADGSIGFICYMFWDVFVLYPGNASPLMQKAAIDVMRSALESSNDNCLASAIHGLGHWAPDVAEAVKVLEQWLQRPTTKNQRIIEYARTAKTGMIL